MRVHLRQYEYDKKTTFKTRATFSVLHLTEFLLHHEREREQQVGR